MKPIVKLKSCDMNAMMWEVAGLRAGEFLLRMSDYKPGDKWLYTI